MAKPQRQGEPERLAAACEAAGVPIAGRLTGAARADGGDLFWVDDDTLAAGRGYRTNAEAHRQLAEILAREGATLERCDLPHDRGASHVLHLMSVVSPVADNLAVVFEPLAPVPLLELLDERGIRRIPIDRRGVRDDRLQRARGAARASSWSRTATRARGARSRQPAARCTRTTRPSCRRATAGRPA